MMTTVIMIIAIFVILIITALFLTAVNWGYKVKHTVDVITHHNQEQSEVKK